ncbi:CocE/NonD family hydrolase [Sediminitomix flava]|uniref:Xaa-Pro dipeptidyl-peptidase C-terminal domain-containing protein n=1 Tax=Sediminitomix flava TaxID=379075 RepID=A0A315Z4Q4_SEDFL|nr:CocE/NonD family hydrolase [Sediminitomix flava]PWJ38008.1 hypothetical protein BC781_108143 [Sediminitomix flava]
MKRLFLVWCLALISMYVKAQQVDSTYMATHYDKSEHFIPMRDGIKLYTLVYTPKDQSTEYPFIMHRTCYNASNQDNFKLRSQPSPYLVKDKYIFVFQDVRGRYQSEGVFTNMTPNIKGNNPKNKKEIDQSSDTWDTIEWLINNIPNNNGKVGQQGISYPGHYTAAALPDAHPALVASSPQAPIADFFFDDFHHNGAYLQSYTGALAVFGYHKDSLTKKPWYVDHIRKLYNDAGADGYDFHLAQGPLKNLTEKYLQGNFFWNNIVEHPNYDEFWQKRNILPHLRGIDHAVLTVGGWFDAEDLYGPLNIYKTIEKHNPKAKNTIVMGPWDHGRWAKEDGQSVHNHIYFGDSISTFFQKEIEANFFEHYLKGKSIEELPEAYVYDTGKKQWDTYDQWPAASTKNYKFYFGGNETLSINEPTDKAAEFSYISDPMKPVPYTSQTEGVTFTPRRFMTDDQRYASRRPDVLTFKTEVLEEDLLLSGEILAKLKVAMTGTDADFVVKVIDVYPQDHPNYDHNPENIIMGGYQQLVRSEVLRGRFRDSFEKPKPFEPNKVTDVNVVLQDIHHTFKKGHKVMIQIHSTWFPYIDRNPQKYVDNIYKAEAEDFIKSEITVYGESVIEIGGLELF